MLQAKRSQLAAIVAAGIVARLALFNWVGIWGDLGFYTYDARLILAGQTPFVDFVGRSPLFNYTYAYLTGLLGHPVRLVRAYIIVWWVLCALPVYGIAEGIRGHRAGLAGAAVMLLSPFSLVYGMWANTQSLMAVLAITAVYLLISRDGLRWYGVAGVLLGLGFLARRSVVTIGLGIALWVGLASYRNREPRRLVSHGTALAAGFFPTIVAGYTAIAWHAGDFGLIYPLWDTHFNGLISSSGRGGFPLVTEQQDPKVAQTLDTGRIPIFNDLCQMCGAWTARTFAKTSLVAIPVIGPLFMYWRDWTDTYLIERDRQYLGGVLFTLAGYATIVTVLAGYYLRVGAIVSLVLFAVIAYRTEPVDRDLLYDQRLQLVLLCLAGLTAGYLYRRRVLHTYYFMDFMPLLSVVAGLLYVEILDRFEIDVGYGVSTKSVLTVAVILALVASTAAAHPLAVVVTGNDAGWFTMSNIDAYQDDVEERADGQPVFAGHPGYVAGSDARLLFDMPRIHYYANTFHDSAYGDRFYQRLTAALRSGRVKLAIGGPMTQTILKLNGTAQTAFESHYCRLPKREQTLYNKTGATIYEFNPDCQASHRPDVEAMA